METPFDKLIGRDKEIIEIGEKKLEKARELGIMASVRRLSLTRIKNIIKLLLRLWRLSS